MTKAELLFFTGIGALLLLFLAALAVRWWIEYAAERWRCRNEALKLLARMAFEGRIVGHTKTGLAVLAPFPEQSEVESFARKPWYVRYVERWEAQRRWPSHDHSDDPPANLGSFGGTLG